MRYLTGIQPSGDLHIGNYFGAIKPMVESQGEHEIFAFIANYHAMTSVSDGKKLSQMTKEAALNFISLGVDPSKTVFWVQSDIKEVLELYWILSQFTPTGLLERAHSYKDKVAKGIAPYHGLFSYPVLMAADILLFGSQIVPVGKDQIQHVEMARDIAIKFNNLYGEILTLPEYKVEENLQTIPGLDGAKMSKSYQNTIEIFTTKKELEKKCKKIVTDSTPLEEPKEWKNCNVYNLAKLFIPKNEQIELQNRYQSGKEGYGHFKLYLADVIWEYFTPFREKRDFYINNPDEINIILENGAKKAKDVSIDRFKKIKEAVGI